MLRSLVLILLVVNAAFFAWSQGWLNSMVGVKPDSQRDPQRLQLQQHADLLSLVTPSAATAAASAEPVAADTAASQAPKTAALAPPGSTLPPTLAAKQAELMASVAQVTASSAASGVNSPLVCLEAGPFNDTEAKQWQTRVQALLPPGAAHTDTVAVPGIWMVFMGPYPDEEQLRRKEGELHRMKGVAFEALRGAPGFSPGLVLGRFKTRNEADLRLDALKLRGIRTARVVVERQAAEVQVLRVTQASTSQQQALTKLGLPSAKAFTACRP